MERVVKLVVDCPAESCNEDKEANGHEEKKDYLHHADFNIY